MKRFIDDAPSRACLMALLSRAPAVLNDTLAPVCLREVVNCVATEPNPQAFQVLHNRLQYEVGGLVLKQGKQEVLWKKVSD